MPNSLSTIIKSVQCLLTQDQSAESLYTAVDGHIAYGRLTDLTSMPTLIYTFIDYPIVNTFNNENIGPSNIRVQFDIYQQYNKGVISISEIYDKLYSTANRKYLYECDSSSSSSSSSLEYIGKIWCVNKGRITQEDKAYRIMSEWNIFTD